MKTPNLQMPHLGGHPPEHAPEAHHHKSALQKSKQMEGLINKVFIALVVLLGAAMVYGLFSASGKPAYFH